MTKTCPDCNATVHSTSQPNSCPVPRYVEPANACDDRSTIEAKSQAALAAAPARKWDAGEHEGCGKDSQQAFLEQILVDHLYPDNDGVAGISAAAEAILERAALAAALADEDESGDNLRLIDYIANKIGLPETDELSQENFDAWMLRSATPAVGGEALATVRAALRECASRCRYDGDLFSDQGNELRRDASWKASSMAEAAIDLLGAQPASPLRVTGAIDLIEESACLIWSELCPGMMMGDDDIPHYEAAAKAVLALSPASPLRGREPDAWQWRARINGNWGSWMLIPQRVEHFRKVNQFNIDNGTYELRPLFASPPEQPAIDAADDLEFLDLEHLDGTVSPPEHLAAAPAHTTDNERLLRLADNIVAHGDSITYPSRQAAREVRNVIRELTAALRTGEII